MNEGIGGSPKGEGEGPEAGGMPVQAVPTVKKFFLIEYLDEVRRGLKWMRTAPKPEVAITTKVQRGLFRWSKLRKARVGMVVLFVIIASSYSVFAYQTANTPTEEPDPVGPGPTGNNATAWFNGSVPENGNTSTTTADLPGHMATFRISVSWTDESAGFGLQNGPDQVGLNVKAPNGLNWTVAPSTASPARWELPDPAADYGAGAWTIDVVGGQMGDITRSGGLPGPCPRCGSDSTAVFALNWEAAW